MAGAEDPNRTLHDLASADDDHCRRVLEEVYLFLDGEIDVAERSTIQRHLDDCSPCLARYGIEQEVKALVARSCGHEDTPGHLRERVLMTLRSVTVASEDGTVSVTTTTTTTTATTTASILAQTPDP